MSVERGQKLRVLEHPRARDRRCELASQAELLALVFGPDGRTAVRRDDAAENAWAALWNGDEAHDLDATGMLSAIVAPLAAGELPVWVPRASMAISSSSARAGWMRRSTCCATPATK